MLLTFRQPKEVDFSKEVDFASRLQWLDVKSTSSEKSTFDTVSLLKILKLKKHSANWKVLFLNAKRFESALRSHTSIVFATQINQVLSVISLFLSLNVVVVPFIHLWPPFHLMRNHQVVTISSRNLLSTVDIMMHDDPARDEAFQSFLTEVDKIHTYIYFIILVHVLFTYYIIIL